MLKWFRNNTIVIIFAITVGIYNFLPTALSIYRMGPNFNFVWPSFNDDTLVYLARAHDLLDGHNPINHPYYLEYKKVLFPQAYLGEAVLAFLSWISHLSLPAVQVFFEFFSPALIFILLYRLFFKFSQNKFLSLIIATVISVFAFDSFSKAVHPQLSFPILLIFLLCLTDVYEEKAKKVALFGTIFTLGISYSLYFYNWTLMLVILGLAGSLSIFEKDWPMLKKYIFVFWASFILGLPYFIMVYLGLSTPFSVETSSRLGVFHSHFIETLPRLAVSIVWLLFYVIFIKLYKLEKDKNARVICILLLANIIFPNHQVLSGLIIQNAVHWSIMPIFIYALAASYIVGKIFSAADNRFLWQSNFWKSAIFVILASLMFVVPLVRLLGFTWSKTVNRFETCEVEYLQNYREVFEWINKNTPNDSVFFADERIMHYIPVYTHANVYFVNDAYYMPASDEQVVERTILANIFNKQFYNDKNFNITDSNRILWNMAATIEKNTNQTALYFGLPITAKYTVGAEISFVRGVWQQLQPKFGNLAELNKFRLDYVVWDKDAHFDWHVDKQNGFSKVYEKGNIVIFKNKLYE